MDCIMLIVLTLLFWKDNFGMEFHEIAGLLLLGVFLLHIIFNWRWVKQVTIRFLSKNITLRTRIGWLMNAGLFVCFILIGISGVFMSRVLFHFNIDGNWKTIHYFCSAIAIILVGIHLGLHLTMIGHMFYNPLRQHILAKKVVLGCFAAVMIVVGLYAIPTTSFIRWLTMPFAIENDAAHGERPERPDFDQNEQNDVPQKISNDEQVAEFSDVTPERIMPEKATDWLEGSDVKMRDDVHDKIQASANIGTITWKSVQYASICILIAIFTWSIIEWLLQKMYHKRKKQTQNTLCSK